MLADRIHDIQQALAEEGVDGWFFSCFQQNDPVSLALLGLGEQMVSRRCYYLIPTRGEPKKLVHALEPSKLDGLPGSKAVYLRWKEHHDELTALVAGYRRLAAQYSPENALPAVSRLDAGTAELVRSAGVELVSSADLVQRFAAVWSPDQLAGHRRSCEHLHRIVKEAFGRVSAALGAGTAVDEYAVQQFILESFDQASMHSDSPPIVAVNGHAADPHYQPSAEDHSSIVRGDFLLIDLWAKGKEAGSVFADICWCGVCGPAPTDRQQEVFDIAVRARDTGFDLISSRFPHQRIEGWEVDEATRAVIEGAGFGEYFIHRTGHSIDTSDHGQGANMDNLETHDTRALIPMTGFSIEPGIYFPGDFGVRTEINVALTPEGAEITGGEPQKELLRLL